MKHKTTHKIYDIVYEVLLKTICNCNDFEKYILAHNIVCSRKGYQLICKTEWVKLAINRKIKRMRSSISTRPIYKGTY